MPIVRVKHESHIAQYCREKGLNLKTSLPGVFHNVGRLVAVSLAKQTQPFGDSPVSQALGVVATTRDIYRVYATPGKAWKDINNEGAADGFWKAVKSSAWDRAAKIINRAGARLKNVPIDNFDGGAQHRQLRNNQGRIPPSQRPVMIVKNPSTLKTYVSEEAGKVGAGKGGWATCALALGGTRPLHAWITKHNSPGTVAESYSSTPMFITMTNHIPYATEILSPAQKSEAVRIAMEKFRTSVRKAMQGNGRVDPITENA